MKLKSAFISSAAAAALAVGIGMQAAPAASASSAFNQTETTRSLQFDPLVPGSYYTIGVLSGLLLLAGAAELARGNKKAAALRLLAGVGAAGVMLNPQYIQENREKLPTTVALVCDNSPSNKLQTSTYDRGAVTAAACNILQQELAAIPGVDIRMISAGATPVGTPAGGTRLFGPLSNTLSDVPADRLGAVFLVTDGQNQDTPANFRDRAGGAPLHVLLTGQEGEYDRRLVIDDAPLYGIVGKSVTVNFHVEDNGVPADKSGPVKISVIVDGQEVADQTVRPGEKGSIPIDISHAGANVIEVKASAVDGELTPINNHAVMSVRGVHDRMRVLLVSGAPTQNERMWRNILKSDPGTDLVHMTIMRQPAKAMNDTQNINELSLVQFPSRELFVEKLKQFDLVIFDGYMGNTLPPAYLDNVDKYVEEGGAVLVLNGAKFTGGADLSSTLLGKILPVAPNGQTIDNPYVPRLSDLGKRHPVTNTLPGALDGATHWGHWLHQVDSDKADGQVVMTGADDKPLLILNHVGAGRVAVEMSDDTWLWERGFDGGGPYAALLQNIAGWLLKDPKLDEEALNLSVKDGQLIVEQQTLSDTSAPVTVHTPDNQTLSVTLKQVSPGLWRATLPATAEGLYTAEQGDKKAFAGTGDDIKEFADPRSTFKILGPVAQQTGGAAVRMTDMSASNAPVLPEIRAQHNGDEMKGKNWLGIRMTDATVIRNAEQSSWPLYMSLLILALSLPGAWYVEGKPDKARKQTAAPDRKGGPA